MSESKKCKSVACNKYATDYVGDGYCKPCRERFEGVVLCTPIHGLNRMLADVRMTREHIKWYCEQVWNENRPTFGLKKLVNMKSDESLEHDDTFGMPENILNDLVKFGYVSKIKKEVI